MRIDLAFTNIVHNLPKTLLAVAGIGTAIVLIFMQLGFRGAVENTATVIYSQMDFDLLVRSPDYLHLADARQIRRDLLTQLRSVEGVRSVEPFHVTLATWRHPEGKHVRGLVLIGLDPISRVFPKLSINQDFAKLTAPEYVLIDEKSSADLGPVNERRFGEQDIGRWTEILQHRVCIAGTFELGAGLTANGAAIMNEQGFDLVVPVDATNFVSMALVRLDEGTSIRHATERLNQMLALPDGSSRAIVLDRKEVTRAELDRWIQETPIGFIFSLGVVIAFIVGAAIVYMILATDVTNRIGEYATLRAIGYGDFFLYNVILRQAFYLAIISFFPSVVMTWLLYDLTANLANIPIQMTFERFWGVFALSVMMCMLSGALAIRKLWKAEPAELF